MPTHNNASATPPVRSVSSRLGRTAAATRAGWVSALACVALYSHGPVAATPSGPGPAALDQTVINQLAMPATQAAPRAATATQTAATVTAAQPLAAAPPIPEQPAGAGGALITGPDIMKAFSGAVSGKEAATAAPRPAEARQKSNAGQPAPIDMDIIRGLAMPAQVPVSAIPAPSDATPPPVEPDTLPQSEQPPSGGRSAVTPTIDTQVAVSQRLAGVESTTRGLAPTARRPVDGLPAPLDVDVISSLAGVMAKSAPAARSLPAPQMEVVRDVFAPETRP